MAQPYYLMKRGKIWYYRLSNENTYHSTGQTVESRAHSRASEEYRNRGLCVEAGTPFALYQRKFYTAECPHCARLTAERRPMTERWRIDQRARLDKLESDPIFRKSIDRLTPGDLYDFRTRLLAIMSPSAANRYLGTVKTVLHEAFLRRDIAVDPTAGVGRVRTEGSPTGIYTPAELRVFVTAEHWRRGESRNRWAYPDSAAYVYALIAATTGARPDSILNAKWGDITDDVWHVRKVKTREYAIPLVEATVHALNELKDNSIRVSPSDNILCYELGRAFTRSWVRDRWISAMASSGLAMVHETGRRTPYSLKHSLITALLNAGADELLVREYVGHSHGTGIRRVLTTAQQHYYRGAALDHLRSSLVPIITQVFGF